MQRRSVAVAAVLLIVGGAAAAEIWREFYLKVRASEADQARPHAVLDRAKSAIELYKLEHNRYPTSEEGLALLISSGLLKSIPVDRWGRPLNYRYPSTRPGVSFELWSLGADGKEGGSGDDRDIGNWNDDA